jgi:biopolymer transport protein ExbD
VAYRWDASANGQHIAQVLGDIQAAGFTRVQVITDPVEG